MKDLQSQVHELAIQVAKLEASRAAMMFTLCSLVGAHHQYEALQLYLVTLTEQQLGCGALGNTLTPSQKEYAREVAEGIQGTKKIDLQELQNGLGNLA